MTIAEHGHARVSVQEEFGRAHEGILPRDESNRCHDEPIRRNDPRVCIDKVAHLVHVKIDVIVRKVQDGADERQSDEKENF